ncbi:hypothetical protein [Edwardsiella piscicida]|uniref:hypothetical protein n=1 Tax=Edwardsiella piscicida TaxID=1263550 RepID=UPI00370D5AFA
MLRIKYFLLLLLLCVSGSLYALDKDEQDLPGLPSGAYDYLVYAVTWQPTFCLLNPAAPGCKAYRADFYTHGIWPYFLSTEQSANRHPSNCIQSPGCPAGSSRAVTGRDRRPAERYGVSKNRQRPARRADEARME